MAEMNGWIRLHRKVLENPVICKDSDHFYLWGYLLLNATHKELPVVFEGKKINLKPGQLITGRKVISENTNISESKVQRILKSFEIEQQIEQQTNPRNRLITIVRWCDYQQTEQQNEQQVNNKRTTNEQQVNTNKNERMKECKNERNKDIRILGEFKNVKLTDLEVEKLKTEYGEKKTDQAIEYLSAYREEKGYKSKNDYLVIRRWVISAVEEKSRGKPEQRPKGKSAIDELREMDEQREQDRIEYEKTHTPEEIEANKQILKIAMQRLTGKDIP